MHEYALLLNSSNNLNLKREALNLFRKSGDKGNADSIFQYGLLMKCINRPASTMIDSTLLRSPTFVRNNTKAIYSDTEANKYLKFAALAGNASFNISG